MPDGRFLSKSISINVPLSAVSFKADYLFGRCIPHLDRDGRMSGNPVVVKAIACPIREDVTATEIPELLTELVNVGLVEWYESDGVQVLHFPGFPRNQHGMRYEREAPSRYPPNTCEQSTDLVRTYSAPCTDERPPKLSKVKLSEDMYGSEFDELWRAWKGKPNNPKKPALKAYCARRREGVAHEHLKAKTIAYYNYCKKEGILGKNLMMQAQTFFGPNERYDADWGEKKHDWQAEYHKEFKKPDPEPETLDDVIKGRL